MQNILKEIIFWALLASGDFHNNEVQCPRKALLADAWSEILAGLSELGLTVITSLCFKIHVSERVHINFKFLIG